MRGEYVCSVCGASGVRLWRGYGDFQVTLVCRACGEAEQGKPLHSQAQSIGWLVPAIEAPGNDSYWGYTSVPDDAIKRWESLPETPIE